MTPDLLGIDFAALRTFLLVHRLGSFSQAAAELGVKQSTVSYTIDRVRRALNDPLFVRQGGGIAATDKCLEAVEFAAMVLGEAEQLGGGREFDPQQATGTVMIATGYLVQAAILPQVMRRIRREARNLRVRISPPNNVNTALFERGSDLAILPVPFEASGVYSQHLFSDQEVALMDPQNPLSAAELDLESYAAAEHVSFELGLVSGFQQAWVRKMTSLGLSPKIVATTYDGFMAARYVQGTDLIATLAGKSALTLSDGLVVKKTPLDIEINVNMFWTAAANRSPLNIWLRQIIVDAVADLEPRNIV